MSTRLITLDDDYIHFESHTYNSFCYHRTCRKMADRFYLALSWIMEKQKQTILKRLHCKDSCASDCAVLRSNLTRSLCDRNALQHSVPCLIKSSEVKSGFDYPILSDSSG